MARRQVYTNQINVRLDLDTYERLIEATDALDLTIGEYVRGLVVANLPRLETKASKATS